ncbi:MAG: hypothetical protein KF782_27710 [Labilithrix sp.]|nr:hypothetical protein [Labilithrix sp.]
MKAGPRTAVLALAALLAPDSARVAAEVALACDDPRGYAEKHAKALAARSVTDAARRRDLATLALILALGRAKRLASVDWKTDLATLVGAIGALRSLPAKPRRWAWVKGDEDLRARSTLELLEIVGRRLREDEGMVLATLEIAADEHELVVVPEKDAARLVALGTKAGFAGVGLFTGAALRKYERARVAREAKEAKAAEQRAARDPHVQRQFIHADGRGFRIWGATWRTGKVRHVSVEALECPLGADAVYAPPMHQVQVETSDAAAARRRASWIRAKLREGFVEVTRDEFLARDAPRRPKGRGTSRSR